MHSPTNFDSQTAAFDSMLGTLQIAGGIPTVPEFPGSLIGLVIVIMIGTVVIFGRSKVMPNHVS